MTGGITGVVNHCDNLLGLLEFDRHITGTLHIGGVVVIDEELILVGELHALLADAREGNLVALTGFLVGTAANGGDELGVVVGLINE